MQKKKKIAYLHDKNHFISDWPTSWSFQLRARSDVVGLPPLLDCFDSVGNGPLNSIAT